MSPLSTIPAAGAEVRLILRWAPWAAAYSVFSTKVTLLGRDRHDHTLGTRGFHANSRDVQGDPPDPRRRGQDWDLELCRRFCSSSSGWQTPGEPPAGAEGTGRRSADEQRPGFSGFHPALGRTPFPQTAGPQAPDATLSLVSRSRWPQTQAAKRPPTPSRI